MAPSFIDVDMNALQTDYQTMTIKQVAEKHSLSPTTVWRRLKEAGVATRRRSTRVKQTPVAEG